MPIREFEGTVPDTDPECYIDDTALLIGHVALGKNSSVWPFVVIRGDVNSITIGENTNIQDHSVLHVSHDGPYLAGGAALNVGNNVTVGHRVILHGCTINDNCLIGMGATIMDGAIIQKHTIIGAGSLVAAKKVLESGYLWFGNPVRQIRPLNQDEIESIEYSAEHYVQLAERYRD